MVENDIKGLNTSKIVKDTLSRLVELLSACKDVKDIIVFGSVARGEATEKSDIDICLFSDLDEYDLLTTESVNESFFKLREEGYHKSFDILVYYGEKDLEEICENNTQCVERDILKDGIIIYRRTQL